MSEVTMYCPVCQGRSFSEGLEVFDDRYGEPNRYRLSKCVDCGHMATMPRLLEVDLPALYGSYYPRKNITADMVAREAENVTGAFAKFLRWYRGTDNQGQYSVRAGETMLDVGCGSGTSLLEAQALGATVFGIEADPNVKPIAEDLGLKIHFGDLKEVPFPGESFDLIVLNQVIEHLPNPDISLKSLSERLKDEGRMVLVFPNTGSLWRRIFRRRWIHWHIPYHLHHFDLKAFEAMVQNCGLKVVRSRTVTPNVWSLQQLRACRRRPKLGQPSPVWSVQDSSSLKPAQSKVRNLFRSCLRVCVLAAFALINRIVDALGMGDSLLVELRRSSR